MQPFQPILLCALLFGTALANAIYDYDYDSKEEISVVCDETNCNPPNCSCFGTTPPKPFRVNNVPQFVMLTFDDAITVQNVKSYRAIQKGRVNKGNGCPISMTFYVCHEYNDYNLTSEMYQKGNEIAVHSISHESDTDIWRSGDKERWRKEMLGMRKVLTTFAKIPESTIVGHRAPFLQTGGNTTFQMLREQGFLYDSSLPTRNYMTPPLWPYTLDFGYPQDCQIEPCPEGAFPGLWVVPMVQYKRTVKKGKVESTFHCSMADACTPYPTNPDDTVQYLMENFNRHYESNRAPFPLFIHEAWLRHDRRLDGYLKFLDQILKKDDVFVVTVQGVVDYMKNPVSLEEYKGRSCFSHPKAGDCSEPNNCNFPQRNRFMTTCTPCPKRYPWVGNPFGKVQ